MSVILSDEEGKPQFVIGIVEDITREKEMEVALEEARSRDSLTGLYNKESGIRHDSGVPCLRKGPGEHGVMMLLDMDDFEDINQKEGNIFADAVLQEVADVLRQITERRAFRFAWAEMSLCFSKNCNKQEAGIIGPRIAAMIRNIILNTEKRHQVAASIGMCGTEVTDRIQCALLLRREHIKNTLRITAEAIFACYLDTSREVGGVPYADVPEEFQVNTVDREILHPERIWFPLLWSFWDGRKISTTLCSCCYPVLERSTISTGCRLLRRTKLFCPTIFPISGRVTTRICSWDRISMLRRKILKSAPICMMRIAWPTIT